MGQGASGEKGENSGDELVKGDPVVWLQACRLAGTEAESAGNAPNLARGGPSGSLAKTSQGPGKASSCP